MKPREIIASTLWSEDRSGGVAGMEPIGGVLLNRLEWPRVNGRPFWWGADLIGLCLCKGQFDGWNWGDPNFRPLLTVDEADAAYAAALSIADRMLADQPVERANGATHYFAKTMLGHPPDFYFFNPKLRIGARTPCFETAHHLFFKIGPGA